MDDLRMFKGVFDNEYARHEIEWYGLREAKHGSVELRPRILTGRQDNYLSKEYHIGGIEVPILYRDNELWMSLTPMEVQSAAYALATAYGDIATTGLGMGYYALRAAGSDAVDSVDVYEISQDVIDFFNASFSDRPGFEKINILQGDVRELMKGKTYDHVFIDPYQDMLPDEVITDIELFYSENEIGMYLFWGYEFVVWAGIEQGLLSRSNDFVVDDLADEGVGIADLNFVLREYFQEFMRDEERLNLAKTGWDLPDDEFVEEALRMIVAHRMRSGEDMYLL